MARKTIDIDMLEIDIMKSVRTWKTDTQKIVQEWMKSLRCKDGKD